MGPSSPADLRWEKMAVRRRVRGGLPLLHAERPGGRLGPRLGPRLGRVTAEPLVPKDLGAECDVRVRPDAVLPAGEAETLGYFFLCLFKIITQKNIWRNVIFSSETMSWEKSPPQNLAYTHTPRSRLPPSHNNVCEKLKGCQRHLFLPTSLRLGERKPRMFQECFFFPE